MTESYTNDFEPDNLLVTVTDGVIEVDQELREVRYQGTYHDPMYTYLLSLPNCEMISETEMEITVVAVDADALITISAQTDPDTGDMFMYFEPDAAVVAASALGQRAFGTEPWTPPAPPVAIDAKACPMGLMHPGLDEALRVLSGDIGDLADVIASKQDTLTAGSGIALEDDVISVTGKQDTLIAGENITIVDNVISAQGGGGSGVEFEQRNAQSQTTEVTSVDTPPYIDDPYLGEQVDIAYSPAAAHGATLVSYPYSEPIAVYYDDDDVAWNIPTTDVESPSTMGEPSEHFYKAGDFQLDVHWDRTLVQTSEEVVISGTVDMTIDQDYYGDSVTGLPNAAAGDTIYSGSVKIGRSFIDAIIGEVVVPNGSDHSLPDVIPLQENPPSDLYEQKKFVALKCAIVDVDNSTIAEGLLRGSAGIQSARIERRLVSTYGGSAVWKYLLIVTFVIGDPASFMTFYSTSTWTGSAVKSVNITGLYPSTELGMHFTARVIAGPAQITEEPAEEATS